MCGCAIAVGEQVEVFVDGAKLVVCPSCRSKLSHGKPAAQTPQQSAARAVSPPAKRATGAALQIAATSKPRTGGDSRAYSDKLELVEDFAERIRRARESLGWDQKTLAAKLKVGENVVKRIESGRLRPTIDLAKRIEEVLGVKILAPAVEDVLEKGKAQRHVTLGEVVRVRGVEE